MILPSGTPSPDCSAQCPSICAPTAPMLSPLRRQYTRTRHAFMRLRVDKIGSRPAESPFVIQAALGNRRSQHGVDPGGPCYWHDPCNPSCGRCEAEFASFEMVNKFFSSFRLEGPEKLFTNRICQHRKCSLEFCRAPIGSYIYSALLPAETVHVFVGSFRVDRGKGRADEWILVKIGCCQRHRGSDQASQADDRPPDDQTLVLDVPDDPTVPGTTGNDPPPHPTLLLDDAPSIQRRPSSDSAETESPETLTPKSEHGGPPARQHEQRASARPARESHRCRAER